MINGNYREGRSRVTEDIRREVSRLIDQEKDWETKKKHPGRWYRLETSKTLKLADQDNPSLRSYEELLREVRKNLRVENPADKPWSTALLNHEPVDPDLIPWIIGAQFDRKHFLAKPLTIREVKWFTRLTGFMTKIKPSAKLENDPDIRSSFIINVLATWAQIYAYREKIDAIAGIQEPDYSDLDLAMANQDYKSVLGYNEDKLMYKIQNLKDKQAPIPSSQWAKYFAEWMLPALMEHIIYAESLYLDHSLGEPEMSQESLKAYSLMLSWNEANHGQSLLTKSYQQRLEFFIRMRQLCKEQNQTIGSTMAEYDQWWKDTQIGNNISENSPKRRGINERLNNQTG
jgi:hypothetical protein